MSFSSFIACDEETIDRGERYGGPIAPCEVVYDDNQNQDFLDDGFDALDNRRLWEYGPFPYWNTSPSADCRNNPVTTESSVVPGTEMYISYPAKSRPTYSGKAAVADGRFPIFVFTHANNDRTCNIFERYYTVMDHIASWGYIVISMDSTSENCKSGSMQNITDRSNKQLAAITSLKAMNEDPTSIFYNKVDTSKIILSGHSRGGGASIVSWMAASDPILGIVDFQGVDTTNFGFGSPDITIPFLGFSASKDVDLNYPYCEPTEGQLKGPYTWVTINGGIHAWTATTVPIEPDDKPGIDQWQQHDIQEYFVTAFLIHYAGVYTRDSTNLVTMDMSDLLFGHESSEQVYSEISTKGVHVRWNNYAADDLFIDDFNSIRSLTADDALNLLGGANSCDGFERCEEVATYKPDDEIPSSQYTKATSRLLVPAEETTGTFETVLPDGFETSSDFSLQFSTKTMDTGDRPDLFNIVIYTDSSSYSFNGYDYLGPVELANRLAQVVIPLDSIPAGESVTSITFELSGPGLFIENLRFTKEF